MKIKLSDQYNKYSDFVLDTYDLHWLQFKTLSQYPYLASDSFKTLYLYHHKVGNKALIGLFLPSSKKAHIYVLDTVRSNQMPNLNTMYNNERNGVTLNEGAKLPESDYTFEVKIEIDPRQVYRQIQKALTAYKDEKRGPTLIAVQTFMDFPTLTSVMPVLLDFPLGKTSVRISSLVMLICLFLLSSHTYSGQRKFVQRFGLAKSWL